MKSDSKTPAPSSALSAPTELLELSKAIEQWKFIEADKARFGTDKCPVQTPNGTLWLCAVDRDIIQNMCAEIYKTAELAGAESGVPLEEKK